MNPPTQADFTLTPELQLILERMRILFKCRLDWLAHLRAEKSPMADDPETERLWRQEQLCGPPAAMAEAVGRQAAQAGRFERLVRLFQLDETARATLEIALALALDPALRQQLPAVQQQPALQQLTPYGVARLLALGRGFHIPGDSPLFAWGLLNQGPGRETITRETITIDPQIHAWLLGTHELHPSLKPIARLVQPHPPLAEWPVSESLARVRRLLDTGTEVLPIQVAGSAGSGKKSFAAHLCRELGLPLLAIDAAHLSRTRFQDIYLCAQRQAFLDGCALGWMNLVHPRPHVNVAHFPLQFVFSPARPAGRLEPLRAALHVELPCPSAASKLHLWRHYQPGDGPPGAPLQTLLRNRQVGLADIVQAARSGEADIAFLNNKLRQGQRRLLRGLAEPLATPFVRQDWIVNDTLHNILDDFIFEARERAAVWQNPELARLFPRGKGLVALLSGPSGTGKTMTAQIAAAELGMDLYRVDLARVVSKYIGETAENIAEVIERAQQLDVVLLFDEADALFSKRTEVKDAHDRYANMDVNYLLQAIENYSGIAFLATNRKSNMDTSFTRRLRYILAFPVPEYEQRKALWQRLLASLAGPAGISGRECICEHLARQIELTGSQIKFAILSALFVARRRGHDLHLEHLIEGIQRELAKEGRSLAEHECQALFKSVAPALAAAARPRAVAG